MSYVETLNQERRARRDRFATAAASPKVTKVKAPVIECPIRPYSLAMLVAEEAKRPLPPFRPFNQKDEQAWRIEIEGAELQPPDVSMRKIQELVCQHLGLDLAELLSDVRVPRMVRGRQIAVYLGRSLFNKSYPILGKAFNKDHSTQVHCYRRGMQEFQKDEQFRASVEMLTERLRKP